MYQLNSIFIWWGRRKKNGYEIRQLQKALKILCCVYSFQLWNYFQLSRIWAFFLNWFVQKSMCVYVCVLYYTYVCSISKQSIKYRIIQWKRRSPYFTLLPANISFKMTLIDFHYRFLSVCFLIKFVRRRRCRGIWFLVFEKWIYASNTQCLVFL